MDMLQILKDFWGLISAAFIAVLLPKQIFVALRDAIVFGFGAFVKIWYVTIAGIFLLFALNLFFFEQLSPTSIKFLNIFILLFCFALVIVIRVKKELFRSYDIPSLVFYGCYSVIDKEYLLVDTDSQYLSRTIQEVVDRYTQKIITFRKQLFILENLQLPSFLSIIMGYKGLHRQIKNRRLRHAANMFFVKNINEQAMQITVNFNEEVIVNNFSEARIKQILDELPTSGLRFNKVIEVSVKLLLLLFTQSPFNYLLNQKLFPECHATIDDSFKIIDELRQELTELSDERKSKILAFLKFWEAYLTRHKAVIFIEQKEYTSAVNLIFRSIKLNPYYPCENYNDAKDQFSKSYMLSLTPQMVQINNELEIEQDINDNLKKAHESLLERMEILEPFNDAIVREIINRTDDETVMTAIEHEIQKLSTADAFLQLLRVEINKFLPKGTEKQDKLYIDRIDECIMILREANKLDTDFPLLQSKIGSLLIVKGAFRGDQNLLVEGFSEQKKALYFLQEQGFQVRANNI